MQLARRPAAPVTGRARVAHLQCLCELISPFTDGAQVAARLPRDISWEGLFWLASRHFLLPAIYPALAAKGLLSLGPAEAVEALDAVHRLNALRTEQAAAKMARLGALLGSIGVEPLWLKGAARIAEDSPFVHSHLMCDLDLWVPETAIRAATTALDAAGYRAVEKRGRRAFTHQTAPLLHPAEAFPVELHYHIVWEPARKLLPTDPVVGRSCTFEWRGSQVRVPCASDQCVHVATQDLPKLLDGTLPLRRPFEIACLAYVLGTEFVTAELRERFAAAGEAALADEVLHLAASLFHLPGTFSGGRARTQLDQRHRKPLTHAVARLCRDGVRAWRDGEVVSLADLAQRVTRRTREVLRQR